MQLMQLIVELDSFLIMADVVLPLEILALMVIVFVA